MILFESCKLLALSILGFTVIGTCLGIGLIFSSLVEAVAINPEQEQACFSYALLGFALIESMFLTTLVVAILLFLIL